MSNKKLMANSSIYALVTVLQKAIGFLLLPLYTRYLSPNDYGVVNIIGVIVWMVYVFSTSTISASCVRFHYKSDNDEERKKIWGAGLVITILSSCVLVLLLFIFKVCFINKIESLVNVYAYISIGLITALLNPVYVFYQEYLAASQLGTKYSRNLLLNFIITLVLNIFFILFLNMKAYGFLLAQLIVTAIFFLISIKCLISYVSFKKIMPYFRPILKYSLPLLPHMFSLWATDSLDRLLLTKLKGSAEVGLYNVGSQFGLIIQTLTSSISRAFSPWFYEMVKNRENITAIEGNVKTITFIYLCTTFCIALFSEQIISIMVAPEFKTVASIIPLIVLGRFFDGIYSFNVSILYLENVKLVPLVTVPSILIGFLFNIILIPYLSYVAPAVSYAIAMFMKSFLSHYFARRLRQDISFGFLKSVGMVLFLYLFMIPLNYFGKSVWSLDGLIYRFVIVFFVLGVLVYQYRKRVVYIIQLVSKK